MNRVKVHRMIFCAQNDPTDDSVLCIKKWYLNMPKNTTNLICNLLKHFGLKRMIFNLILDIDLNKYCHTTILSLQSIAHVRLPMFFFKITSSTM